MIYLSDIEISKLQHLNDDPALQSAIRKVLYSVVDLNELVEVKDAYSNAQLGQITRAYRSGKHLLDLGFRQLQKFKQAEVRKPPETNPAL